MWSLAILGNEDTMVGTFEVYRMWDDKRTPNQLRVYLQERLWWFLLMGMLQRENDLGHNHNNELDLWVGGGGSTTTNTNALAQVLVLLVWLLGLGRLWKPAAGLVGKLRLAGRLSYFR